MEAPPIDIGPDASRTRSRRSGAQPSAAYRACRTETLRRPPLATICLSTSSRMRARSAQGLKNPPVLLDEHCRRRSNAWMATSCRRSCADSGLEPPTPLLRIWRASDAHSSANATEVGTVTNARSATTMDANHRPLADLLELEKSKRPDRVPLFTPVSRIRIRDYALIQAALPTCIRLYRRHRIMKELHNILKNVVTRQTGYEHQSLSMSSGWCWNPRRESRPRYQNHGVLLRCLPRAWACRPRCWRRHWRLAGPSSI